ncbi:MAG TPA: ATP-binding protein, partial [Terrimesophilobacter sp.]|nr:ATP-binding protein [Terrimesophilobacter sp.]
GTLRAASLGLATARVDSATMAAAALDRLAALVRPSDDAQTIVGADELQDRLRALVTALAPTTEVRVTAVGAPKIPEEVALAITEACGEALRNSILHAPAGRDVSRTLRMRSTPDAVEVTVEDDGDGFDTSRVPPHRLGIARSIVARMRALPGGDAAVRSMVGSGTTVSVSWRA